jgi:hypothetical protein
MKRMLLNNRAVGSQRAASCKASTARPTEFGELVPAIGMIVGWLIVLSQSVSLAIVNAWLLVLGVLLVAWTVSMRLHYTQDQITVSLGPWRRSADLTKLVSVTWKKTGGGRSRGTIRVRDDAGRVVPIYIDRFDEREVWGPRILWAADKCNATVDAHSRAYLDGRLKKGALVH